MMEKLKAFWQSAKIKLAAVFGGAEKWLVRVWPAGAVWIWVVAVVATAALLLWAVSDRDPSVAETVLQPVAVAQPEVVHPALPPVVAAPPVRNVAKAKSYRSPVSQVQSEDVALPPEPEEIVWQAPLAPVTRESVDQFRAALR